MTIVEAGQTKQQTLALQLAAMLKLSELPEKEEYGQHFNQEFWSLEEFAAIAEGLTLRDYLIVKHKIRNNQAVSPKEFLRATNVSKTIDRFCDTEDHDISAFHFVEERLYVSTWRFIKWIAQYNVRITVRFFENLPLILQELYMEFQPENVTLLTKSRFCREHHRAQYLKHAAELQRRSPIRLSRQQIFSHPHMRDLQKGFRNHNGTYATYKKRTITDSWLPMIDKLPRGRPKKNTRHE